jgi:hypothetical protein
VTQHGHVSEESRKNTFEPALSGELLTYYQGSDGGCSLTEEIRLCDAMILKSLYEENFDETRKWIGTKAGLVRSRPRSDSETQELLTAHNATMAHLANQELERMEARHRREDEERERARQAAAAKDAQAEAKPYVTSPDGSRAQPATTDARSSVTTQPPDGDGSAIAATADGEDGGEEIVEPVSSGGEELRYIWSESQNRYVAPDGSPLFGGETGQATGPGTINGYVVDPPTTVAQQIPTTADSPRQTEPETEPDQVPASQPPSPL